MMFCSFLFAEDDFFAEEVPETNDSLKEEIAKDFTEETKDLKGSKKAKP